MTNSSTSHGLQFVKLDLHVHTPASYDFRGDVEPSDIVAEALRKGLHGIAITDHNTGGWIDQMKVAAQNTRLVIFPGVEITCMAGKPNIHIIALFDPSKNTDHIMGLLSALDLKPELQGTAEAVVMKSPIEIIDKVHEWEGIAVPAHVDSDSGIFKDMRGEPRKQVIRHPRLLALEVKDCKRKDSKGKTAADYVDGTDHDYQQRKLAVYQASDNRCANGAGHCIQGIGLSCSYFKIEAINLEGLYQCFVDPDTRIRQDYEYKPNTYPRIASIKISDGFFGDEEIPFHEGLNSILGAKGAGKSLIVELLRFGLGQPPDHPIILDDHIGKLKAKFGEYSSTEITFIDETGKKFVVTRTYRPIDGSPFDVAYDPGQVMPVLFLSQNEIIKIAEDQNEQLKFIDRFFDFRTYKSRIRELEDQLLPLDTEVASGLRAYPEVQELQAEIASLREEVEKLDKALQNSLFERYRLAERKRLTLEAQKKHFSVVRTTVENLQTKIEALEQPEIPSDLAKDAALLRNQQAITKAFDYVARQTELVITELAKYETALDGERDAWNTNYFKTKNEYEEHIRLAGGDYRVLASDREKKAKRLEELQARLESKETEIENLSRLAMQRNGLLDELQTVYKEYTQERRQKCDKFQKYSSGKLRLNILGSSNSDEFEHRLSSLKRGSYLRESDIVNICHNVDPREFIGALLRYIAATYASPSGSSSQLPSQRLEGVAKKSGISLERMVKLADVLTGAIDIEELLALQYKAVPQDRPEILFNIDENDFQPLNAVSVGQKSIALLIMALSDGSMPVVIDQPEDSLDIRTIWEDICLKLRGGKENRQFIFTTHNSSVAVASDTDHFIIVEGSSQKGRVVFTGSMDHEPLRQEVLRYLEGGIETYGRKYRKYRAESKLPNNS